MGFVSVATRRFDAMNVFYRETLGCHVLKAWDRDHARGILLDLGGLQLEIMDVTRERTTPSLGEPDGRVHLVIEVTNLLERHQKLPPGTPPPQATSWGAHIIPLVDPDGLKVFLLQWDGRTNQP